MLEDQAFSVAAPGVLHNDAPAAGDVPCVAAPTTANGGTVELFADGSFIYAPPPDHAGPDSFTYRIVPPEDLASCASSTSAVVKLTVTAVNDRPAISVVGDCAGGVTVEEDAGTYLGGAACIELDPGPANESAQELAEVLVDTSGGLAFQTSPTVSLDGILQFRPAANAFGSATVSIAGRDNGGTANGGADLSSPIELTISVTAVPDAPVANADAFGALRERTLNIGAPGVLGNDSDADGGVLIAILVSSPVHGALTLAANGSFSYTPDAGYVGADAFSYRASDGALSSATRIVTLTITAVPVPSPTPVVSPSPSAEPTLEPSVEATTAPTLEPEPSLDPEASVEVTLPPASASIGPGATPEPDPSSGSSGPSLPLLLVAVLFGVLLVFAGAYYVPRWFDARRGAPLE